MAPLCRPLRPSQIFVVDGTTPAAISKGVHHHLMSRDGRADLSQVQLTPLWIVAVFYSDLIFSALDPAGSGGLRRHHPHKHCRQRKKRMNYELVIKGSGVHLVVSLRSSRCSVSLNSLAQAPC